MKRILCGLGLWMAAGLGAGAATNQPSLLWQLRLLEPNQDFTTTATPAVADDGTIYYASFFGRLHAVSKAGKKRWTFQAGREIASSPAIGDDGTIYFGSRDWSFYAITPAGRLKWTFKTGAWVDSSPALAVDGTIYFGSWDNLFYALNPDGTKKWTYATGGVVDSSPAIAADGTIYFGSHDNNFYALKPDGTLRWKFAAGGPIPSSPAIGTNGTVYFASMDHCIYALSPEGKQIWQRNIRYITSSSPVVDANGDIHISPNSYNVSLRPDGHKRMGYPEATTQDTTPLVGPGVELFYSQPWRAFVAYADKDMPFWRFETTANLAGSPVMSKDGIIYIIDGSYLYAFGGEWGPPPWRTGPWPMFRANPRHTGRVELP